MITDNPSHRAERARFLESDRIRTLDLPQDGWWLTITKSIESAIKTGGAEEPRMLAPLR